MGASVWKRVKYGSNIPATNEMQRNAASQEPRDQSSIQQAARRT